MSTAAVYQEFMEVFDQRHGEHRFSIRQNYGQLPHHHQVVWSPIRAFRNRCLAIFLSQSELRTRKTGDVCVEDRPDICITCTFHVLTLPKDISLTTCHPNDFFFFSFMTIYLRWVVAPHVEYCAKCLALSPFLSSMLMKLQVELE